MGDWRGERRPRDPTSLITGLLKHTHPLPRDSSPASRRERQAGSPSATSARSGPGAARGGSCETRLCRTTRMSCGTVYHRSERAPHTCTGRRVPRVPRHGPFGSGDTNPSPKLISYEPWHANNCLQALFPIKTSCLRILVREALVTGHP